MQALVLCGGLGTRLRSVISDRPKPMAPIGGKPFLHLLLASLVRKGVTDFVLATGFQGGQIEEYFGDGKAIGARIAYSLEETPLGTAGAIRLAEPLLHGDFLVLNGDTFVGFDPVDLAGIKARTRAVTVMALRKVEDSSRYGSVTVDGTGRVRGFAEKGGPAGAGLINAGVYLADRELLAQIEPGKAVSLEREVIPRLLDRGIFGCETGGLFIDIGVPEDYHRAQDLLAKEL